jgi:hypothetical protein
MAKLHLYVKATPAASKIHSHPTFVVYDENSDDYHWGFIELLKDVLSL